MLKGSRNQIFQPRVPIILCALTSHSREKITDATSGAEEQSDEVCESADALPSFKSDAWKHFGSQEMIKEKNGDGHADTARL